MDNSTFEFWSMEKNKNTEAQEQQQMYDSTFEFWSMEENKNTEDLEECRHLSISDGVSCDDCFKIIKTYDNIRDFTQNFIIRKLPSGEIQPGDLQDMVIPLDVLEWAKEFLSNIFSVKIFRSKMRKAIIGASLIYGYYNAHRYIDVKTLVKKMGFEQKNLLKAFKAIDIIISENFPTRKKELQEFSCTLKTLLQRLCYQYNIPEFDPEIYIDKIKNNVSIKNASLAIFYLHTLKSGTVPEHFLNINMPRIPRKDGSTIFERIIKKPSIKQ